jgi:hypothetical protein
LFGSQPVWDPNGDCNDAGFCPKVRRRHGLVNALEVRST